MYLLFISTVTKPFYRFTAVVINANHGNATTSSETSVGTNTATVTATPGPSKAPPPAAKFRHGLLQLMIHTIDPMHDDETLFAITHFDFHPCSQERHTIFPGQKYPVSYLIE
ncbi:unnamed protein product [Euphydryas editha]|uniref:Uncharacterized protein n=1 Tax=Euphydryas editha TaxID=104508 RepID=A0AAU9TTJ1_EUPED|nr:unnamed protein product [Euphydryas editha]